MSAQRPNVGILVIEILTIILGLYLELGSAQIFASGQFQSLQGPVGHASQQNSINPQSIRRSSMTIFTGSNDQHNPRTLAFQGQPHADHWTRSSSNGRDASMDSGRWLDRSLTNINNFQQHMSAFSQQSTNAFGRGRTPPISNNFQSHQPVAGQQVLAPVMRSSSIVTKNNRFSHGSVSKQVNTDSRSNSLVVSSHVQSQPSQGMQQSNSNQSPGAPSFRTNGRATLFQNLNHTLGGTNNVTQNSLPRQRSEMWQHAPNSIGANKAVLESRLLNAPHTRNVWSNSVGEHVIDPNIRRNTQNVRSRANIPDVQTFPMQHLSRDRLLSPRREHDTFHSNAVQVPTFHTMPHIPIASDLNKGNPLSSQVIQAPTLMDISIDQSGTQNLQGGINGQLINLGSEVQRPAQWIESSNSLSSQRGSAEPNFAIRNYPFPITNGISVQDQHAAGLNLGEASFQLRDMIQPTVTASSIVKDLGSHSLQTVGIPINLFGNAAASNWLSTSGGPMWQVLPFMEESPDSPDIPDPPSNENENENQQSQSTNTNVPPAVKSLGKNEVQQMQERHTISSTLAPSVRTERVITMWTPIPLKPKMLSDLVQVPDMHTRQNITGKLDNKINGPGLTITDLNQKDTTLKINASNEQSKKISEENTLTGRQLDQMLYQMPFALSDHTTNNESNILQSTRHDIKAGLEPLSINKFLSVNESRRIDSSRAIMQSEARLLKNQGSKDLFTLITEQQSPHFKAQSSLNTQRLQHIQTNEGQSGLNSQGHSIPNTESQSGLKSQRLHSIHNTEAQSGLNSQHLHSIQNTKAHSGLNLQRLHSIQNTEAQSFWDSQRLHSTRNAEAQSGLNTHRHSIHNAEGQSGLISQQINSLPKTESQSGLNLHRLHSIHNTKAQSGLNSQRQKSIQNKEAQSVMNSQRLHSNQITDVQSGLNSQQRNSVPNTEAQSGLNPQRLNPIPNTEAQSGLNSQRLHSTQNDAAQSGLNAQRHSIRNSEGQSGVNSQQMNLIPNNEAHSGLNLHRLHSIHNTESQFGLNSQRLNSIQNKEAQSGLNSQRLHSNQITDVQSGLNSQQRNSVPNTEAQSGLNPERLHSIPNTGLNTQRHAIQHNEAQSVLNTKLHSIRKTEEQSGLNSPQLNLIPNIEAQSGLNSQRLHSIKNTETQSGLNTQRHSIQNTEAKSVLNKQRNSIPNTEAQSGLNSQLHSIHNTEIQSDLNSQRLHSIKNTETQSGLNTRHSIQNTEAQSVLNTQRNSIPNTEAQSGLNSHQLHSIHNTEIQSGLNSQRLHSIPNTEAKSGVNSEQGNSTPNIEAQSGLNSQQRNSIQHTEAQSDLTSQRLHSIPNIGAQTGLKSKQRNSIHNIVTQAGLNSQNINSIQIAEVQSGLTSQQRTSVQNAEVQSGLTLQQRNSIRNTEAQSGLNSQQGYFIQNTEVLSGFNSPLNSSQNTEKQSGLTSQQRNSIPNTETQSDLNSQRLHLIQNTESGFGSPLSNETMKTDPISSITKQVRVMIDILSQLMHQNTNISPKKETASHNTFSQFANKTTANRVEPAVISVEQTIYGNLSGNGSEQQTCSPFSKQFYCMGKDMFANVSGVAEWCIQKCQNDSCLHSICYCSCSASTHDANSSEVNTHLRTSKKVSSHGSNTSGHPVGQSIRVNPTNANISYNIENQKNTIIRHSNEAPSSLMSANLTFIKPINPKQKSFKPPFARRPIPLLRSTTQNVRQNNISNISTTEIPSEVEAEEIETEDLPTTTVKTRNESHPDSHHTTIAQDSITDVYYDYTTTPGYETFGTTLIYDNGFKATLQASSLPKVYYSTSTTIILDSQNSAVIGEFSPDKGVLIKKWENNTKFPTNKPARPQQIVSAEGTVRTEFNQKRQSPLETNMNGGKTHLNSDNRGGEKFNKPKRTQNSTVESGNNLHGDNRRGNGLHLDRTTESLQAWDASTGDWRSRQTTLPWNHNRNRWDLSRPVTKSSWNKETVNDRQVAPPRNRNSRNWGTHTTTTSSWQGHDNWQHDTLMNSPSNWRNRPRQDFNGRPDRSVMRRSGGGSFNEGGRHEAQDQWSNAADHNFVRDSPSSWSRGQVSSAWGNDWRFSPPSEGRRNNNGRNLRDRWNRRTTTPPSGEGGEETKGAEGADKK